MKRVLIDLRPAQTGSAHTGIGVYTRELVRAIQALSGRYEFYYLTLQNFPHPQLDLPPSRIIQVWRPTRPERWHVLYDWLFLPSLFKRHRIDLYHSTIPTLVLPTRTTKLVVTLYDLIPDLFPGESLMGMDAWWIYQHRIRAASQANAILVISDATARDLIRFKSIPEPLIHKTDLAANGRFQEEPQARIDAVRTAFNLPERYMLYLGGYSARKNISTLLLAYERSNLGSKGIGLVLVGVPKNGPGNSIRAQIQSSQHAKHISCPGFIPEEQLPAVYSGAMVFVYPSLYEGFGLPLLESMSCGTPVITSTAGSLPEVAGDAALLFDPTDDGALTALLLQCVEDEALRGHLRAKGLARAAHYSWQRCAQETVRAYAQVLAEAPAQPHTHPG